MNIAQKLGYISVIETLKVVTETTTTTTTVTTEEKYRVVAPEAMHETFMSDSEEEGGTLLHYVSVCNLLTTNENGEYINFFVILTQNEIYKIIKCFVR